MLLPDGSGEYKVFRDGQKLIFIKREQRKIRRTVLETVVFFMVQYCS